MNIQDMRKIFFHLMDFAGQYIEASCSDWDQGVIRKYFDINNRSKLSIYYNWKPYWGYNEKATIVHFHGPKPLAVEAHLQDPEANPFPHEWDVLYQQNQEAYKKYLDLFRSYL